MASGGTRKGAGRKKGSVTTKTRDVARGAAEAGGITPIEYMLKVMRDSKADKSRRDDMAKAAAPYIHPRLSAVAVADSGSTLQKLADRLSRAGQRLNDGQ